MLFSFAALLTLQYKSSKEENPFNSFGDTPIFDALAFNLFMYLIVFNISLLAVDLKDFFNRC
jgi:hypothetical protein